MEDMNEFENCRFYGGARGCRALRDMYCLSDGKCSFYKPEPAEAETEKQTEARTNGISADKIAEIRELYKGGMTQEEVAKTVGASRMTVSKYVRGI